MRLNNPTNPSAFLEPVIAAAIFPMVRLPPRILGAKAATMSLPGAVRRYIIPSSIVLRIPRRGNKVRTVQALTRFEENLDCQAPFAEAIIRLDLLFASKLNWANSI